MAVVAVLETQTSSMSYGFAASLDLEIDIEKNLLILYQVLTLLLLCHGVLKCSVLNI